jgi:hypothetical protein
MLRCLSKKSTFGLQYKEDSCAPLALRVSTEFVLWHDRRSSESGSLNRKRKSFELFSSKIILTIA